MKTTTLIPFVSLAMLFTFFIAAEPLIAEGPTAPTSIRQAAGKSGGGEAPKTIRWSVLAPEKGKPFNDPFAKLTRNQLADLSYVVRVQRLIAENKIKADGVDAKEAARLARKLTAEGVDIGWLMAQRKRIQQIRGLQVGSLSKSIAKSLGDKNVTLTGYVIPIEVNEGRLTEFFLVPTIAACSHESAPPRLQVVYVMNEQGIMRPDKGVAVRVTGRVEARITTGTIPNGNGQTPIRSAYTIASAKIETYKASKK